MPFELIGIEDQVTYTSIIDVLVSTVNLQNHIENNLILFCNIAVIFTYLYYIQSHFGLLSMSRTSFESRIRLQQLVGCALFY